MTGTGGHGGVREGWLHAKVREREKVRVIGSEGGKVREGTGKGGNR